MATSHGFWNGIATGVDQWDRSYDAEDIARCFEGIIKTGVAWDTPDATLTGTTIKIEPFYANINGYWFYSDANITMQVSSLKRGHNSIVLRWDLQGRQIITVNMIGTSSRYEPVRNDNVYELVLFDATVSSGGVDFDSLIGDNYYCPYTMINAQSSTDFPVLNTIAAIQGNTDPQAVTGALAFKEYLTEEDIQLRPTTVNDNVATWVSPEYIGDTTTHYLGAIYCEDIDMVISSKQLVDDTLTVEFDASVAGLDLILHLIKVTA